MIVRPRPHWLRMLFVRRGSIVTKILTQQTFIFLLSCGVVFFKSDFLGYHINLTSAPFSLMGVALAIFLGFRINASYDRYWEARKLWGGVLIDTRNLARQALTFPVQTTEIRTFILGLAAFAASMRNQLRGLDSRNGLESLLPKDVLDQVCQKSNVPVALLLWQAEGTRKMREVDGLDPVLAQRMEENLDNLSRSWGGCERIANTPLPFTYTVILHRSAYLYCILLPFGLEETVGIMMPLVVAFVSYTFFTLEEFSHEIEEPFGMQGNDLPLDALVIGIESSLKEMLGEPVPALPLPDKNFVLS
ncbi:MAG TPA: bestrophin family ion channel [Rhodocyclaceae bacterium]|jgi:putative membrane protein